MKKLFVCLFLIILSSVSIFSEQLFEYEFSAFPTKVCVYVDKDKIGFTPLSTELAEGIHEIIAKKEGYSDKIMMIKVDVASRKSVYLKLAKDNHVKPVVKQLFLSNKMGERKKEFRPEDGGIYIDFYIDNWISKKRISYVLCSAEGERMENEGKFYPGTTDWTLKDSFGYDFSDSRGKVVLDVLKVLEGDWRVEVYADGYFLDSVNFVFATI